MTRIKIELVGDAKFVEVPKKEEVKTEPAKKVDAKAATKKETAKKK